MTRFVEASPPAELGLAPLPGALGDVETEVHSPSHSSGLIPALDVYDQALAAHLAGLPPVALLVRAVGRSFTRLALHRWCSAADAADRAALDRLRIGLPAGAGVLDMGCGPGRHAGYLHHAGLDVLGVDTSAAAVALTRRAGAAALRADVLGPLPGLSCRWDGVLLLDGNIGIGGQPASLLRRLRRQLSDDGEILIELEAPSVISETVEVRIEDDGESSDWLSWARVGAGGVDRLAAEAGLTVSERWHQDGRWFVRLGPAQNPLPGPRVIPVRAEPHLPVRPGAH